ncbi:MAG: hypothetical protein M1817_002481 [Caeruleum heppii]|nr:MAG: hypothetical protein M1817_002481 [Caeruleum heppii]
MLSFHTFLYALVAALFASQVVTQEITVNATEDALLDSILSQNITSAEEIDPADIEVSRIPYRSFKSDKLRSGSRKRQYEGDGSWQLFHSRQAVNGTAGRSLWAVPVNNQDLRALLERAIADAKTHTVADITNSFTSTAKGLRLFMTSIDDQPNANSFNWQDYGTVAETLLKAVLKNPQRPNSIVGTVVSPNGTKTVDVVSLPAFVHIRPDTSVEFLESSSDSTQHVPRAVGVRTRDVSRAVDGTTLTLRMSRMRAVKIVAHTMAFVAKHVVDMVLMDDQYRPDRYSTGYSAIDTSGHWGADAAISDRFEKANFRLRTFGERIDSKTMLNIAITIRQTVDQYAGRFSRNDEVSTLAGKVVDAAGNLLAEWGFGLPTTDQPMTACSQLFVRNPDDSLYYACLAS